MASFPYQPIMTLFPCQTATASFLCQTATASFQYQTYIASFQCLPVIVSFICIQEWIMTSTLFTINTITVFLMHPLNTVKNKIQLNAYYMQSLSDGFTCMCPEGFEGTYCQMETNRDHCFPFPCENGGNCTVSPSTQYCGQYSHIYTDGS